MRSQICFLSDGSLTEKGIEIGPHSVESRDRNRFLIGVVHYVWNCLMLAAKVENTVV